MSNGKGKWDRFKWDRFESPECKEYLLLKNGWAKMYVYKSHGWPCDGWLFTFIGQDYPIGQDYFNTTRKDDWLPLDVAWEQFQLAGEE